MEQELTAALLAAPRALGNCIRRSGNDQVTNRLTNRLTNRAANGIAAINVISTPIGRSIFEGNL